MLTIKTIDSVRLFVIIDICSFHLLLIVRNSHLVELKSLWVEMVCVYKNLKLTTAVVVVSSRIKLWILKTFTIYTKEIQLIPSFFIICTTYFYFADLWYYRWLGSAKAAIGQLNCTINQAPFILLPRSTLLREIFYMYFCIGERERERERERESLIIYLLRFLSNWFLSSIKAFYGGYTNPLKETSYTKVIQYLFAWQFLEPFSLFTL